MSRIYRVKADVRWKGSSWDSGEIESVDVTGDLDVRKAIAKAERTLLAERIPRWSEKDGKTVFDQRAQVRVREVTILAEADS